MKKFIKMALVAGIAIAGLIEVGVRISGIADFPLYDADSQIGYIPKPSQSGDFLRKNHWQFNSKSMGTLEFVPSIAIDNLLIGDSVVLGGNPFRQEERLGPQLSRTTGQPVWPIAAGSWALRNELTYLRIHPEVVNDVDRIIFVLNDEDFDQASSWSCEMTHPRSYPILASLYAFRKYVWDWEVCDQIPDNFLVPPGNWKSELHQFLTSEQARGKQIIFFLYPNKSEALGEKSLDVDLERHAHEIINESSTPVSVYSVGRDPRWKSDLYRDGIHPSVDGNRILAEIISKPASNTQLPQ